MSTKIEQPKKGDKVRIVIEGEWETNGYKGGMVHGYPHEVVSLEVLKPAWQDGDVVQVKYWGREEHTTNVRRNGKWTDGEPHAGDRSDNWIAAWERVGTEHVRTLVRGGEPVR